MSRAKKILVLVNNVWPPPVQITGISVIYDCQKELARSGVDLHILTSIGLWDKNSYKFQEKDASTITTWHATEGRQTNITFHTYNMGWCSYIPRVAFILNRFIPIYKVWRLHKIHAYDILHEYTSTPSLIYRSWLYKILLSNVDVFHTIISEIPTFMGSVKWLKFKPIIDGIICSNKRILKNFNTLGYNSGIVRYLSLGVNDKKLMNLPSKYETRNKYSLNEKDRVFLFLAPLEDRKGYMVYIDAAIEAIQKSRNSNLSKAVFIIGTYDSPEDSQYEVRKSRALSRISEYKDNFIFLEGVLNIRELFAIADCSVFPQTRIDGATGHPVTLLEAMVAGNLVVSSDIYGIDEVVEDKTNGFLFPVGDWSSLAKIFLDIIVNDYKCLALNGRDKVISEYSVSKISNNLLSIYKGAS